MNFLSAPFANTHTTGIHTQIDYTFLLSIALLFSFFLSIYHKLGGGGREETAPLVALYANERGITFVSPCHCSKREFT